MSFQQLLANKKKILKPTQTIRTNVDGTRMVEQTCAPLPPNYGFVVDTKPDDTPAKIAPNLYLGSQDCTALEILQKHHITTVLSVGMEPPIKAPNITYHFVECLDLPETPLKETLAKTTPIIRNAVSRNKNVLVHCNAGVSRSVSVVIGYLIEEDKITFREGLDLVKKVRTCARPNDGFMMQLADLSEELSKR